VARNERGPRSHTSSPPPEPPKPIGTDIMGRPIYSLKPGAQTMYDRMNVGARYGGGQMFSFTSGGRVDVPKKSEPVASSSSGARAPFKASSRLLSGIAREFGLGIMGGDAPVSFGSRNSLDIGGVTTFGPTAGGLIRRLRGTSSSLAIRR
jgi:hypothetical protein